MIINNKQEENKSIVINDKKYYEKDLNENMRNSLIALSTQRTNKAKWLMMSFLKLSLLTKKEINEYKR